MVQNFIFVIFIISIMITEKDDYPSENLMIQ